MKKQFICLSFAGSMLASIFFSPVQGYSQENDHHFTPEQRKEILSIVRQAMKEDPTLLEDGIKTLKEKAAHKQAELSAKTLKEKKDLLMHQLPTDGLMGNPAAKVTITEFYDPRCPYCKKVLPVLTELVKKNKNVKVILKAVPILGENSILQSQAIIAAARQNNYVAMMKLLMNSQEKIDTNVIKTFAQNLKLNADQIIQDMKAASVTKALGDNIQLIHDLGIEGTPAFIINGSQLIPGAVNYDQLNAIIQKLS